MKENLDITELKNKIVYKFLDKPEIMRMVQVLLNNLEEPELIRAFEQMHKWNDGQIKSACSTLKNNIRRVKFSLDLYVCFFMLRNRTKLNSEEYKYWAKKTNEHYEKNRTP